MNMMKILLILTNLLISIDMECRIHHANACKGAPKKDEKFPDEPTMQELYSYCDNAKKYMDCVNDNLKCCDLSPVYRLHLGPMDRLLKRVAGEAGKHCAGISRMNAIQYECLTDSPQSVWLDEVTEETITKETLPPCDVHRVDNECGNILKGRIRFLSNVWSIDEKFLWCSDVRRYVVCVSQLTDNCNSSSIEISTSIRQTNDLVDQLTKMAGIYCPGGIKGCRSSAFDMRCKRPRDFFKYGSSFIHHLNGTVIIHSSTSLLLFLLFLLMSFF
ncbi:hypothetical protein SNEBB_000569 [Seison nebaliae]|nr:hypothetical protein SNEBB_000569 [Seison nebaliae]